MMAPDQKILEDLPIETPKELEAWFSQFERGNQLNSPDPDEWPQQFSLIPITVKENVLGAQMPLIIAVGGNWDEAQNYSAFYTRDKENGDPKVVFLTKKEALDIQKEELAAYEESLKADGEFSAQDQEAFASSRRQYNEAVIKRYHRVMLENTDNIDGPNVLVRPSAMEGGRFSMGTDGLSYTPQVKQDDLPNHREGYRRVTAAIMSGDKDALQECLKDKDVQVNFVPVIQDYLDNANPEEQTYLGYLGALYDPEEFHRNVRLSHELPVDGDMEEIALSDVTAAMAKRESLDTHLNGVASRQNAEELTENFNTQAAPANDQGLQNTAENTADGWVDDPSLSREQNSMMEGLYNVAYNDDTKAVDFYVVPEIGAEQRGQAIDQFGIGFVKAQPISVKYEGETYLVCLEKREDGNPDFTLKTPEELEEQINQATAASYEEMKAVFENESLSVDDKIAQVTSITESISTLERGYELQIDRLNIERPTLDIKSNEDVEFLIEDAKEGKAYDQDKAILSALARKDSFQELFKGIKLSEAEIEGIETPYITSSIKM